MRLHLQRHTSSLEFLVSLHERAERKVSARGSCVSLHLGRRRDGGLSVGGVLLLCALPDHEVEVNVASCVNEKLM